MSHPNDLVQSRVLIIDRLAIALSSLWQPLTRRVTASVTLHAEDRLTKEVIDWVAAKILWPRKARFWVAHSDISEMERMREQRRMYGSSRRFRSVERNDNIQFAPENQSTWFIFRRRIFVVHQKANYVPPSPYSYGRDEEAVKIVCIGRSMTPIKDFLDTCRNFGKRHIESFVSIYTSMDARWQEQNLQPARPLDTIHLDAEVKQNLIADICDYVDPKTRRFYADRGIPYRRGYLLHGPPGTGKRFQDSHSCITPRAHFLTDESCRQNVALHCHCRNHQIAIVHSANIEPKRRPRTRVSL